MRRQIEWIRGKLAAKKVDPPQKLLLARLATRIFNTPLMITADKLQVILGVLGPRMGLSAGDGLEAVADFSVSERRREYSGDGIGVIPVYDTLVQRNGGADAMSGLTTYTEISAQFHEALSDSRIDTILFDVDSPGGEVGGVFDLVDEIYRARGTKPIYAIANECAFSAAYAIASAADRIFLPRTGSVGSIGIIAMHIDQSAYDAKEGYRYTAITAGARKNDFSPHSALSDEGLATAQNMVDQAYDLFCDTVARNRGIALSAVRNTEAAIYYGQNAIKQCLADEIASYGEVIGALSKEDVKPRGGKGTPARHGKGKVLDSEALTGQVSAESRAELEAKSIGTRNAEADRITAIRTRCQAVKGLVSETLAEDLILKGVAVEELGERMAIAMVEHSARSITQQEVNGHLLPMDVQGENLLILDAKKRAQAYRKDMQA